MLQADRLIFEAFSLDPDCVEAYEYLAEVAASPMISLLLYKNGMMAARKKLGEKFFKENKGHFWGIHETRPFMRCMQGYADTLYMLGQSDAALDLYFEMLELNPNDNQGVRNLLGLYCLQHNKLNEFEQLAKNYSDEITAFYQYNLVLFSFLKEGDTEHTRTLLAEARQHNKHVPHLLTSKKNLPPLSDKYSLGAKSEAIYYTTYARDVWQSKTGATSWLEKMYRKQ